MMDRKLSVKLAFCALGIGLAVILDAWGAHGLKKIVAPERVAVFERANRYLMFHCLSMVLVLVLNNTMKRPLFQVALYLMLFGVFVFCGSLYLATFKDISENTLIKNISSIAPMGGMSLILSWFILATGFIFYKNK